MIVGNMKQGNIGKGLAIAVILLFLGLTIQPSIANELSVNTKIKDENKLRDKGLGFISCFVFYI